MSYIIHNILKVYLKGTFKTFRIYEKPSAEKQVKSVIMLYRPFGVRSPLHGTSLAESFCVIGTGHCV
jgi:hypothetical protein